MFTPVKRGLVALLSTVVFALPATAAPDEVVEFHDVETNVTWRFDLTNLPCENSNVALFAMMSGIDPSAMQAGTVTGKDAEGKPYTAGMCFAPAGGETIIILDEQGNGGRIPYDPKPKS